MEDSTHSISNQLGTGVAVLGVMDLAETKIQVALLGMQKAIWEDIGWVQGVYVDGGMCAIEARAQESST